MTRVARTRRCPEDVLGWIPWYGEEAEGGASVLTARERGAVEAHAAECSDCRAELDMIAGAPFEIDVALPDPDRMFEEITARIEAGEPDTRRPLIPIGRPRKLDEADYGKVARWIFDDTSEAGEVARRAHGSLASAASSGTDASNVAHGPWARSGAWSVAAAIALLFLGGLAGAFIAATTSDSSAVYELAAADSAAAESGAPMIDVVFIDSVSVHAISQALRNVGVEIVSGPSTLGVYRLRLVESALSIGTGAKSVSDAAAIAARLRANEPPIMIFAEPVP